MGAEEERSNSDWFSVVSGSGCEECGGGCVRGSERGGNGNWFSVAFGVWW